MNLNAKKTLEDGLRNYAASQGIKFEQIDVNSVAKELGLLEQIELNHPSKEVKQVMTVVHPDPENPLRNVEKKVTHVSRVLMDDVEAAKHATKMAKKLLIDYFKNNPGEQDSFVNDLLNPQPDEVTD